MNTRLLHAKDNQAPSQIFVQHPFFFFFFTQLEHPFNKQASFLHTCTRTSAVVTRSCSIQALVQVTLKIINYSQHIRHDWLSSFGRILSSQYLFTCVEGGHTLWCYVAILWPCSWRAAWKWVLVFVWKNKPNCVFSCPLLTFQIQLIYCVLFPQAVWWLLHVQLHHWDQTEILVPQMITPCSMKVWMSEVIEG